MSSKRPITILIAESINSASSGAAELLAHCPDFLIVGRVDDGNQAVRLAKRLKPAVVLMDLDLTHIDGIEATRLIKAIRPERRVLIFTNKDTDEYLFAALAAGADGYCLKCTSAGSLDLAIRAVAGGAAWLDSAISARVIQAGVLATSPQTFLPRVTGRAQTTHELTRREREILACVARGMSNKEVAKSLFLSVETVKVHVRNVLKKLDVDHRTHAAVIALKLGLIPPSP